jgi:type II secretory pathway pseudopilin PulG
MRLMEYALAILLISSLTTNGLLALWAATSRQHWFLRTAVYLGCLAPLLLVPAYEPFIALALQGAIIAGGVALKRLAVQRSLNASEQNEPPRRRQFALATMLQAMVLVAIAAAIAVRVPELNRFAWQSIVAIGLCSGLLFATIYWAGTAKRRITSAGVAFGASLLIAALVGAADWFIYSTMTGAWVEENASVGIGFLLEWNNDREVEGVVREWLLIIPCSALAAFLVCWLWGASNAAIPHGERRGKGRTLAATALIGVSIVLAAPAALALYALLTPEPIPIASLPEPNGFDDLIAAQNMLGTNLLIESGNFDRDSATEQQLVQAVDETAPAIARLELGLQKKWMRQVDYSKADAFEEITPKRTLLRALDAAGRLATVQGNYDDALHWHLNGIKHGFAFRRGGLMIDDLVGCACSGIGCAGVFEIKEQLDGKQCAETIAALGKLLEELEPTEDFEYRDQVWVQRAMGWLGHLGQWRDHEDSSRTKYRTARRSELAKCRLLMAELALQAYRQEHGRLPNNIQELESEVLPAMPIDPFSPTGKALQFKRSGDEYVLYSVGANGVDENGEPQVFSDTTVWGSTGDLRLDVEFNPQLQPSPAANPDGGDGSVETAEVEESDVVDEESN